MKVVYTQANCPGCVTLKAQLAKAGEPFKEIKIGRDITREDFLSKFPAVRTVPYVVDNDKGE
jgi:glutaredoxin